LAILATVGAVGVAAVVSPALAEARGIGPDVAFGLAAVVTTVLAATTIIRVRASLRARPVCLYGGPVCFRRYHHWHYR
jgi:hypothetical protein